MKVGIVGCGFIGNELARFAGRSKEFKLIGVNDIDRHKSYKLIRNLKSRVSFMELGELIKKSELVIESAGKDAIKEILKNKNLDKKGKRLLIMSTGGLIDNLHLLEKIKSCKILLPSGAIGGLDAIKSVSSKINR